MCGAAGSVGKEGGSSQQLRHCLHPSCSRNSRASECESPGLPASSSSPCYQCPPEHSLPLLSLVQLCLPGMSRDKQKGSEDLLMLEHNLLLQTPDQTLPRLKPFEIPAGLHSCNFSFQAAASATEIIIIYCY